MGLWGYGMGRDGSHGTGVGQRLHTLRFNWNSASHNCTSKRIPHAHSLRLTGLDLKAKAVGLGLAVEVWQVTAHM